MWDYKRKGKNVGVTMKSSKKMFNLLIKKYFKVIFGHLILYNLCKIFYLMTKILKFF